MDAHLAAADVALRLLTVGHGTATESELAGYSMGRAWSSLSTCAACRVAAEPAVQPRATRDVDAGRRPRLPLGAPPRWLPRASGRLAERGASPSLLPCLCRLHGHGSVQAGPDARARRSAGAVLAIMCAESLWWRCHRRLIADAATLLFGADVLHLGHDGRLRVHRLTDGVRRDPGGGLVYDVGANLENPPARMSRASPGAPALWSSGATPRV